MVGHFHHESLQSDLLSLLKSVSRCLDSIQRRYNDLYNPLVPSGYHLFITIHGYCIDNLNQIKCLIQNFLDKAMPPDFEPIKKHFKNKV
jgi:hypothetical protein